MSSFLLCLVMCSNARSVQLAQHHYSNLCLSSCDNACRTATELVVLAEMVRDVCILNIGIKSTASFRFPRLCPLWQRR